MAANLKVDVRSVDSVKGLYKINLINIEDGKERIATSIDCGIEGLYVIRDTLTNAIEIINNQSKVGNN